MLLKELSDTSKIYIIDLLTTSVGQACYVVDSLKKGNDLADIIARLRKYNLSILPTQEIFIDDRLIRQIYSGYKNILVLNDVIDLC